MALPEEDTKKVLRTNLRTSYNLPGRVACIVKLEGGANAAPKGQGVTDKDFLNVHGRTVTTNQVNFFKNPKE